MSRVEDWGGFITFDLEPCPGECGSWGSAYRHFYVADGPQVRLCSVNVDKLPPPPTCLCAWYESCERCDPDHERCDTCRGIPSNYTH